MAGKAMPLDLEADAELGNVMLHGGGEEEASAVAEVLAGDRLERARRIALRGDLELFVSHFATCPQAGQWRR